METKQEQSDSLKCVCNGENCEGCGLRIYGSAYSVPNLAGVHCSVECIETHIFGDGHCRWCGSEMEKPQGTTVDSRLCSEDCSESYYAHVRGDRTAALGTGKRLGLWLQARKTNSLSKRIAQSRSQRAFQAVRTAKTVSVAATI